MMRRYMDILTEAAETIMIDGHVRQRLNNLGMPIAKNEAGLINFWRWFGDSKVIDERGRPRVVYHGTNQKFAKFNFKKATMGIVWFTSNRAAIEAGEIGAAGSGIIKALYVKIEHPANWKQYDAFMLAQFKGEGLDGAILPDSNGFDGFVLRSDQIKIARL